MSNTAWVFYPLIAPPKHCGSYVTDPAQDHLEKQDEALAGSIYAQPLAPLGGTSRLPPTTTERGRLAVGSPNYRAAKCKKILMSFFFLFLEVLRYHPTNLPWLPRFYDTYLLVKSFQRMQFIAI